ncbi:fused response regulator/phosphatase [Saccharobesus litoralis]|uniref:Fused response regulator/phosphatase n=1 Tax=Saccharobesus litoralis TaxID=2172099 RepID=A0A2S0VS81_9ALTE|nr:fused response regulator/phosphatase [Saccharobesus litoralis]AWB67032.1 fused response regulator/phosphatase [Saccharobesus litoralis]
MRILVVDDQDLNRTMLQFMLESEGYEVILAEHGKVAIDIFDDVQPDIVLLDVVMPVMDGYETAPLLKQKAGDIHLPIIFITALDDQKSMLKCLEVGGDDFLAKPFDKVILTAKIRAHQRNRELSQSVTEQNKTLLYHQNQTEREHLIVEHIFSNALNNNNFVENIVDYHLSPASMFNGDLFLANRSPMGGSYILLGDFTGHGLAAAVGALPTAQTFFAMTAKGLAVGDIAKEINSQLLRLLPDDMFCAACIIELSSHGKALSVWSGGMPDVLLINKESGIKQRIPSQHMALGILEDDEFDIDSYNFEVHPLDKLIAFTDGVIEAHNARDVMFGQERLESLYQSNPEANISDVIETLRAFCGDIEQQDDVSMCQVNCLPIEDEYRDPEEKLAPLPWQFTLNVCPDHIRETDPVSHILDMISGIKGMTKHRSTLFLVLAELYNNAVDHGLLNLDSKLKDGEDGFFNYYMQRQEALDNLTSGQVTLTASYDPDEHLVCFIVKDTGKGFNCGSVNKENHLDNQHGRGISLIGELCQSIAYSDNGTKVEVKYSTDSTSAEDMHYSI